MAGKKQAGTWWCSPCIGGEATPSSVPRESIEACYCVRPHGVYMNTIKRMALVLATVGMVSTQAYAGESAVKMTPLSPQLSAFSQDDINSMFEASGKPMQLAALSTQEMKDTEGAWGPVGAIIGGLGGLGGYTLNAMISGSRWSPGAALTSTALGAAAGAVAGPNGVVWGFNSAIGGGAATGVFQRVGW